MKRFVLGLAVAISACVLAPVSEAEAGGGFQRSRSRSVQRFRAPRVQRQKVIVQQQYAVPQQQVFVQKQRVQRVYVQPQQVQVQSYYVQPQVQFLEDDCY